MSNEASVGAAALLPMIELPEPKAPTVSRGLKGISQLRKSQLIELLSNDADTSTPQEEAPCRETAVLSGKKADKSKKLAAEKSAEQVSVSGAPAEVPRHSRRHRAVSQGAVEPVHIILGLSLSAIEHTKPTPEPDTTVVEIVPDIELSGGDDTGARRPHHECGRRGRRDHENHENRGGGRENRENRGEGRENREARPVHSGEDNLAPIAGIFDVQENHAFVRTSGYLPGPSDVHMTLGNVRRWGLRTGDAIAGAVRLPCEDEYQRQKYNALVRVNSVNGMTIEQTQAHRELGKLTPVYPSEQLRMETLPKAYMSRVTGLVASTDRGQCDLIVSPPKADETMAIQQVARTIGLNNSGVYLMVVLADEHPEEVTDVRSIVEGEVTAPTFSHPTSDHTTVAELATGHVKRLIELGQDIVVLLDLLTRLSCAHNLITPTSGRVLSGSTDTPALYLPKKFFDAACNISEDGSPMIIASAPVETGSRMERVIFGEFKGIGNMRLRLSRRLAERRIFPVINLNASGIRRKELLFKPEELHIVWKPYRALGAPDQRQGLRLILSKLKETQSSTGFLVLIQKATPSE